MDRPVLTDLSLDVHIHICEYLDPSYILALRRTCKAFYEATLSRIVWIHALIRICHENSLFLPTFPIADMTDAELERAATAPFRWIALSASKDRHNTGCLPLHGNGTTRIIKNPMESIKNTLQIPEEEWTSTFSECYLVPGGRYLVTNCWNYCLAVLDLGYVSDGNMSMDGKSKKIWATKEHYYCIEDIVVHPTPDGLGIRILTHSFGDRYVFEIYPDRQISELAKIAEFNLVELGFEFPAEDYGDHYLYGDKVYIYTPFSDGIITVWDFMTNNVASWSIGSPSHLDRVIKVTETAVIILHAVSRFAIPSVWIFQIPPLTTKMTFDIEDLSEITPVLAITYPDHPTLSWCQKPDTWYLGDLSSFPLYVDILKNHKTGNFSRSRLDIASDLTTVSFIPISTSTIQYPRNDPEKYSKAYRICNGGFVNIFTTYGDALESYTSSTSSGTVVDFGLFSDSDRSQLPSLQVNAARLVMASSSRPYSFCPASGRLVYTLSQTSGEHIVISDFL